MELTELVWTPEKLTASLIAAAAPAAKEAAALAEALNPAKHLISIRLSGGPTDFQMRGIGSLAGAFEHGTSAHEEEPRGKAFKFTRGDGGFASGPIQVGGMAARPYLRPAIEAWPALYNRAASAATSRGIAGVL